MSHLSQDLVDQLSAFALDLLSDSERTALEARIEAEPALRKELATIRAALEGLGSALPEVAPRPSARARLMEALNDGPERFGPFLERLAERMYLSVEKCGSTWRPLWTRRHRGLKPECPG